MRSLVDRLANLFVKTLYIFLLACILFLLLVINEKQTYAYKVEFVYSNGIYMLIAIFGWLFVLIFGRLCPTFIKRWLVNQNYKIILSFSILLGLVLIYLTYNYYFITGWDAGRMVSAASELAKGGSDIDTWYFSTFPNNILLLFIFKTIIKLHGILGVLDVSYCVMGIIVVQCICAALTGYLLYRIALWVRGVRVACYAWLIYVLTVGISPWLSIPYSDPIGLIIPIMILYLYTSIKYTYKLVKFKYMLMAFLAVIGFKIKPQLFIALIAVIVVLFLKTLKTRKIELKRVSGNIAVFILGGMLAFGLTATAQSSMGLRLDTSKAFGVTHYLMMGLNSESNGGFSPSDVDFTQSQKPEERTRANLQVAKERISNYGISGLLQHLKKKLLSNYGDGTWAWAIEGEFFVLNLPDKNEGSSPFLKSFYYPDRERYIWYQSFAQIMWMLVLVGCLLIALKKGKLTEMEMVLVLMILGITIFELIFEARARYLFSYIPIFTLTAALGLDSVEEKVLAAKNSINAILSKWRNYV